MASLDIILTKFRDRENEPDILKANWYIIAAPCIAAVNAGKDVPELYRLATSNEPKERRLLIQRRLKEALLKTGVLYGFPRVLNALYTLFKTLDEDEIDNFSPRWDSRDSAEASEARKVRAKQYFETIWTPAGAQANLDFNMKYHRDMNLLCAMMPYEWFVSEDAILSNVETQLCTTAALICVSCPVQAVWHTKGIVRHGGSKEQARFAQDFALEIARFYDCKTDGVVMVDDVDFEQ